MNKYEKALLGLKEVLNNNYYYDDKPVEHIDDELEILQELVDKEKLSIPTQDKEVYEGALNYLASGERGYVAWHSAIEDITELINKANFTFKLDREFIYCKRKQGVMSKPDNINNPSHYQFEVEVYDIIEILLKGNPNYTKVDAYNIGNVIKYLFRAGLKGEFYEDIGKANWYLSAILNEGEEE